jgi:hypothetical protein
MADQPAPHERDMDEKLARWADDVQRGQTPNPMTADPELQPLTQLVVRLDRAVGRQAPPAAMTRRIRDRLAREWQTTAPAAPAPAWQQALREAFGARPLVAVLALAAVVVLVLIAIPGGSTGGNLPGAAGGAGAVLPALIVLAALAAVAAWWWNRRQK